MITMFWILAIIFVPFSLLFIRKVLFGSLNKVEIFFLFVSIAIASVSIGVIADGGWIAFASNFK